VAVGDFSIAELMRFEHDPIAAGLAALEAGAGIFTDIHMVEVGIQKKGHSSPVSCALDHGQDIALADGCTRTSAGFRALGPRLAGSIVVIGNAPSALLTVSRMVQEGTVPALVIGTPVGFVNAQESKEVLRTINVPSVSNVGTRGGTPVAVAALNEIITMFSEGNDERPSD
jgi:precorrin-8X/cobalt-precorrin-8 methylmutase